jgi:hypothetical protein
MTSQGLQSPEFHPASFSKKSFQAPAINRATPAAEPCAQTVAGLHYGRNDLTFDGFLISAEVSVTTLFLLHLRYLPPHY